MSESAFMKAVISAFNKIDKCLPLRMHMPTHAGVSDLYVLYQGRSYWIECKAVPDDTEITTGSSVRLSHGFSEIQKSFLRSIESAGGISIGLVGYKQQNRWHAVCLRGTAAISGVIVIPEPTPLTKTIGEILGDI